MREIKFRAWHKNNKNMCSDVTTDLLDRDYLEFMQYTGVLDFNGVEVYEGDIVRLIEDTYRDDDFEPFIAGEVKFRNGSFYITDGATSRFRWDDYIVEVVGNVYETPELLVG